MAKNAPIVLTGNVYCSWNTFTFIRPCPDRLKAGDLVLWSWSGDSRKPSSRNDGGLFRCSVFDGKERRNLKVKGTRAHGLLRFKDDGDREQKLSKLVREMRALKDRTVEKATGGFEVALLAEEPKAPAAVAKEAAAEAPVKVADAPKFAPQPATVAAQLPTQPATAATPAATTPKPADKPAAKATAPRRRRRRAENPDQLKLF